MVALASFISCGNEDASMFQLPDTIYTIDKVYDVGNSGNATDLRIEVSVASTINTSDLVEVRVVLAKSAKAFSKDQIAALTPGNFFSVPVSGTPKQTIKPTSIKDSDGDNITNGTAYRVYVAVIGKENARQLSAGKDITLANKPIYAGDYTGSWEDLGPPGPGSFPITLRINDNYSGSLFYTTTFSPYGKGGTTEDVKITLNVTGTTFTCQMDQLIGQYLGGGAFGAGGGCPASKNLSGTIQDDVSLIFNVFTWADCDGTREVKMKFQKN